MPARRTPRPLKGSTPKRVGRPDLRDYSSDKIKNPGNRPSEGFDWDEALTLHALAMMSLGYPLSAEQKKRIEDYASD